MFNIVENVESCYSNIPSIIYYSHIPTAIVSLIVGFFVFLKNRSKLANILIFLLALDFSIWSFFDLILWIDHSSSRIMFFWMAIIPIDLLLFVLSFYLLQVFLNKTDVKMITKILFAFLILPTLVFMSTRFNLLGFDATSCNGLDGFISNNYLYCSEILILILMIFVALKKILKEKDRTEKLKYAYFSIGLLFFLTIFLLGNMVASLYETNNYLWSIAQYGLFGMVIFMIALAYIIVVYKAFNIKLIGAQALVISLVVLIGSQFFFIQNNTNRILTGITLALAVGFGWFLIKSVKNEVKRKEELQYMSDQLAKANDQLRKLDNAKSDFISIASHQLRTPLTSIKGFISLLSEGSYGKVTPIQQETLNKVYQSNERLIHLVEDLLDISRIESGRMEFDFAPCQLADLCQEVVDGFAIRAKNSNLYLEYKNPAVPLPEIIIDAGKVREVISNMVDNALKYTPKGGVKISLEQKEANMRVTISDTGIGIPVTELPYLFSKFSRGKDIGRLNATGTGLGLYVGKSMIETNGGKIWAESEGEGKGSQFIIELPLQQSPEILEKWGK